MPIYDFECQNEECGVISEQFVSTSNVEISECPLCNKEAKKIFSSGGMHYCGNQDAEWIRSIREIVDKEGGQHCQKFLKYPTRKNYHKWMKKEGVRHFESGESIRPPLPDQNRIYKELAERAVCRFTPQMYRQYNQSRR